MATKNAKAVVIREPEVLEARPYSQSFMDILTLAVREGRSAAELRELYAIEQAIQGDRQARQKEEARIAWNVAMAAVQKACPPIRKSKMGAKAPYAPLEDVEKILKPIRDKHDLWVAYSMERRDTTLYGFALVGHIQGYSQELGHQEIEYLEPIGGRDGKGAAMNRTQADAGTITYLRRYILATAFNLTYEGDDTDGTTLDGVVTAQQLEDLRTLPKELGYKVKDVLRYAITKPEELSHKQAERLITLLRAQITREEGKADGNQT